ncbi:DUF1992 domain-containing protein [Microbacterium sp. 1P10UB]|uniref:DnaJ family domain-containing protein n=1 Tax=unclassified Microbacterium TaxID=2609290 RepID=UPI0039A0EC8B
MSDPREAAARYRAEQASRDAGAGQAEQEASEKPAAAASRPSASTWRERSAYVETAIQQAVRRGEFDNLPGAGKPLAGLGGSHDPDWWLKRKIEAEGLTGLGPPALLLRTEYADLDARMDEHSREADVREALEDFNRRVIEARRQLLGGPPVVTPLVDVDERVGEWRERRDAAARAAAHARAAEREVGRPSWRERRATRRARRTQR